MVTNGQSDQATTGVDCSALPGVVDVSCLGGACVVERCKPGFSVSLDGSYCTPATGEAMEYALHVL